MLKNKYYKFDEKQNLTLVESMDNIIKQLQIRNKDTQEYIERLEEENHKLKEGIWEKEGVSRYKKQYEEMKDDFIRGFPITQTHYEKIRQWLHDNNTDAYEYHYEFYPSPLGTAGKIVCSNGKEFWFQDVDEW